MTNIELYVSRHSREIPNKPAIVCGRRQLTYRQLWREIVRRRDGLKAEGVVKNQLHAFRTTQDEAFIVEYMATHCLEAVAVPLGADMPEEEYNREHDRLGKIILKGNGTDEENIADVLFTTGTTGRRKGVMISYRAVMADTDNLILSQGYTSDTVFVITGPLNHIGSLSKVWPVMLMGGTLVILEGMKDMEALFDAFSYPSRRMATFMVPASIRMMLRWGASRLKPLAGKIEFLETGGAALTQTEMEALCKLLPHTRLYNTYASTEGGIVCTYDYNDGMCASGCVGFPATRSSVSIMRDGTIACGGATLMSGYLDDKELTDKVLYSGLLHTNDLGQIDRDGLLHLKGRKDDTINIGGYKLSPVEIESVAMSHPDVADCICCGANSDIFGYCAKLYYVLADGSELTRQQLARYMAAHMAKHKVPRLFEQVGQIKHLFNGKVDRKYYEDKFV